MRVIPTLFNLEQCLHAWSSGSTYRERRQVLSENTHRCLFVVPDRVERRVVSTRLAILILGGKKNQQGAASSAGWFNTVVNQARWRSRRSRVRREGLMMQQPKTD